jgi:hypothetical protein
LNAVDAANGVDVSAAVIEARRTIALDLHLDRLYGHVIKVGEVESADHNSSLLFVLCFRFKIFLLTFINLLENLYLFGALLLLYLVFFPLSIIV